METARPLDMLNKARDKRVIVELKNGKQYVGKLTAFDIHINVVLDEGEEREDGNIKRKIGNVFIRGDAIILISSEKWFKWVKEQLLWVSTAEVNPISTAGAVAKEAIMLERKYALVVVLVSQQN